MGEIAVMLDAPQNTVKSYLHRARQLLHAQLESIVAAVVISASVATAASAYGRRLLVDH